ncbi:MAG: hypothetical protein QNJ09_18700 [Paracoccaceae bacterium]|nr:hypothetical protein [Paracoccaceae bacterium]
MTTSLMAEDLDRFVEGIQLPYQVQTSDVRLVYETENDLRAGMHAYRQTLRDRGITRMERRCASAGFVSDSEIEGFNSVMLYRGNELALPPYLVRMNWTETQGIWRIRSSCASLRDADWPVLPTDICIKHPRENAPTGEDDAQVARLQVFLNHLNQILLTGDFEAWRNIVSLPLTFITRKGTDVHKTVEELKADFELYMSEFRIHGVSDMVRHAKSAKMVGGDQMIGVYSTYILRSAEFVVPPYESSMTLQRDAEGHWRVSSVMNALGHLNWSDRTAAQQETP